MPSVVACFKWVLDEADIVIRDDASIDFSLARGAISTYDLPAIQAAVDAAAELGIASAGLTLIESKSGKTTAATKEVLSRGLDSCYVGCISDGSVLDSRAIAKGVAAGLARIDDVKLVICGSGSSDLFARQLPARLAVLQGWPVVTDVRSITFDGDAAILERELDDAIETVRVVLPAVVSVTPEINTPSLPTMKAILGAKKKPTVEFDGAQAAVLDAKSAVRKSWQGYITHRAQHISDATDPAEAAQFLADAMKKERVL